MITFSQYDIPFYGTYLFFRNRLLDLFQKDLVNCFAELTYHALKDGIVLGLITRLVLLFN